MVEYLLDNGSWQEKHWNPYECTIEKAIDDMYAIVDHSIQETIAISDNQEELANWLLNPL